jgi:hypothetical protein
MNATTLKGLSMKYKHFREIEPSNKTDFIMLYFAACRSLHELENAIRRTNNGNLTCRQTWLLHRIQHKLTQMVANTKLNTHTTKKQTMGQK